MSTAMAQDNPYIVKTKGCEEDAVKVTLWQMKLTSEEEAEPTDFMGKNFRYYSMCDWKVGMRFMVVPEKYDLLVNTFHDAGTNKEVSSARCAILLWCIKDMRHDQWSCAYQLLLCENDNKNYYYELPSGTFDDYCYGKMGVPTLAYLGDVDKARELLMDQHAADAYPVLPCGYGVRWRWLS